MSHSNKYTCEHCKGVFQEGWSEAEANAEAESLWGVNDASRHPSTMARICDDCYRAFMGWYETQPDHGPPDKDAG